MYATLARQVRQQAVERARRARWQLLFVAPPDRGRGVPTRSDPHIAHEEVDGDEVVMRVTAVPVDPAEGPRPADEVLAALHQVSRDVAGVR